MRRPQLAKRQITGEEAETGVEEREEKGVMVVGEREVGVMVVGEMVVGEMVVEGKVEVEMVVEGKVEGEMVVEGKVEEAEMLSCCKGSPTLSERRTIHCSSFLFHRLAGRGNHDQDNLMR